MSDIFIQAAYVLASVMCGMGLGAGLLMLCLRNAHGGDPKSYWSLHATLNALSKLASQTETGKKIDIELIYLLGEHLKSVGILVDRQGWVGTRQLEEWIASTISLHSRCHNDQASVIRRDIQLPAAISRIHAQKLTEAILWVLNGHDVVRHISLTVLQQDGKRWWQPSQVHVRLRVGLWPAATGQPSRMASKMAWKKDAAGSFLCDFRLACKPRSPEAYSLQ